MIFKKYKLRIRKNIFKSKFYCFLIKKKKLKTSAMVTAAQMTAYSATQKLRAQGAERATAR